MRNAHKILFGKHERKTPLRRARLKWEDNIKSVLKQMESEGVDKIHLA